MKKQKCEPQKKKHSVRTPPQHLIITMYLLCLLINPSNDNMERSVICMGVTVNYDMDSWDRAYTVASQKSWPVWLVVVCRKSHSHLVLAVQCGQCWQSCHKQLNITGFCPQHCTQWLNPWGPQGEAAWDCKICLRTAPHLLLNEAGFLA